MKKLVVILYANLILTGCLVTRQNVRESVNNSEPLTQEQQIKSTGEIRYQEMEELQRQMNGRIEVLENSMNMLTADKSGSQMELQNDKRELNERLKIYQESLTKMESQLFLLSQKVDGLQQALASSKSNSSNSSSKSSWEEAEQAFGGKRWKESIVAYEKYRTLNPKGKRYAEATYKIGVSFSELNLKSEAKSFYGEVIDKFPKNEWAKKAQSRLKSLK